MTMQSNNNNHLPTLPAISNPADVVARYRIREERGLRHNLTFVLALKDGSYTQMHSCHQRVCKEACTSVRFVPLLAEQVRLWLEAGVLELV
jgi:hypothetical protein